MQLTGAKVIVTGGARGLGRALVDRLLRENAEVCVFDKDQEGLQILEDLDVELTCVECDVSDYGDVFGAIHTYFEVSGVPDVLVNNVGILHSEPLVGISQEGTRRHTRAAFERVLAVNLNSVFYMTSFVAERMLVERTGGVIVNVSSVCAAGNAGQTAYSAAKAGVNAMTAVWAKELGPVGIRVVAVAPGFCDTESTRKVTSPAGLSQVVGRTPSRRLGRPLEVANCVIAVIKNDFFNGKVIELDGGLVV